MPSTKLKMNAIIKELEDLEHSQSYHIKELSKKENFLGELITRLKKEISDNKDKKGFFNNFFGDYGKKDTSNNEELELEVALLRSKNENIGSELNTCQFEYERVKMQNLREKEEFEKKLDTISEENISLKKELSECKKEIQFNKTNLLSNEMDRGKLLKDIAGKNQELETLRKELQDQQSSYNKEIAQIDELENDLKHLKAIFDTAILQKDEFFRERRKFADLCEQKERKIQNLEKELEKQKNANAEIQKHIDLNRIQFEQEMSKIKEQHENELARRKHEYCELEQKCNDVCCLKQTLESKLDDKIQEVEQLVKIKRKQEEELGHTKSDIQELRLKAQNLKKELENESHELSKVQADNRRIREEKMLLEAKEQEYKAEEKTNKEELFNLNRLKAELEVSENTAKSKLAALEVLRNEEKDDMTKMIDSLEKEIQLKKEQHMVEVNMLREEVNTINRLKVGLEVSNDTIKSNLSDLEASSNKEKREMKNIIDVLEKKIRDKEMEISGLNSHTESLQKKLQDYHEKEEKLLKQENDLKQKLFESQNASKELHESCKILKTDICNAETDFKKKEGELLNHIDSLEKKIEEKEQTNLNLSKSNSFIEECLQVSKTKEINLVTEISSIKTELSKTKTSLHTLEQSHNNLQTRFNQMEEKATKMNEENKILSAKYKDNKQKLDKTVRNLNTLNEDKDRLQAQMNEVQIVREEKEKENKDLLSKLQITEKQCMDLVDKIEKLTMKPRKLIELSVFSSMKPGLTDIAVDDLRKHLQKEFEKEDTDFTIQSVVDPATIKRPAVVLCISISRLGADVQEALRGIRVSPDVAIIIFHHKEAHALPSQSSEKILTGSDYKQLGSIIDMAVLSSRGIYKCDMNDLGFKRLFTFLKRFSVSKK